MLTSTNCLIVRLFSDAVCHRIYNKRRYIQREPEEEDPFLRSISPSKFLSRLSHFSYIFSTLSAMIRLITNVSDSDGGGDGGGDNDSGGELQRYPYYRHLSYYSSP